MDSTYLTNPLTFLVQVILGLYTTIVMLRFLLQVVKADFYNPISQFIVKVTTPVLKPLRGIIPGFGGLDISSLVLAWIVQSIELLLVLAIAGAGFQFAQATLLAIPEIIGLIINIFLFAILIQVILSWVGQGAHNPAITVIYSLTEPVLRPARRLIPPVGGLDLSPMAVIIGLYLLEMLLLPPIKLLINNLL